MQTGFIIFDIEEPSWEAFRCTDRDDVVSCLANVFETRPHPTILSYEIDGFCRDVSEEFRPAPIEETPTREIGWRRSHTEFMTQSGAFER